MPIVRPSKADLEKARRETDWARLDAMTDEDIARQIEENPDAAPDITEALLSGRTALLPTVDVKVVRAKTSMSQRQFAEAFGIPLRTLQEWEQGRAYPDATAITYLRVIEREPDAVLRALDKTAA